MFVYTYLRRTDPVGYPKSRLPRDHVPGCFCHFCVPRCAFNANEHALVHWSPGGEPKGWEVSPTQPEFLMATYHSNMLIWVYQPEVCHPGLIVYGWWDWWMIGFTVDSRHHQLHGFHQKKVLYFKDEMGLQKNTASTHEIHHHLTHLTYQITI